MRLPPFRYFRYLLGTVNAVMAVVIFLASLAFSNRVNIVPAAKLCYSAIS